MQTIPMGIDRKKLGYGSSVAHSYLLLLLSLCFLLPAYGAVDSSLYQGEAPVASYLPADWQKAVVTALEQVLVKVSGNPNVMENGAVRKAIANPNAWVKSYNYVTGVEGKALTLQVRFSPKAINNLLQNSNQLSMSTGENTTQNTATSAPFTMDEGLAATSSSPNATLQSIHMMVSGVSGLQDYTAVLDYLRHIDNVVEVNSKQTQGNRILLVLKINKTVDDLTQAIARENKLVKGNSTVPSVLIYRWMPGTVTAIPVQAETTTSQPLPVTTTPSVSAATQPQPAPQTSSGAAPIVEGVPVSLGTTSAISTHDNSQAQSFAAPASDNSFASPQEGATF